MRKQSVLCVLLCGGLLMLSSSGTLPGVSAQQVKDQNERGRRLYYQYCASCHGQDGRGTGPAALSLKTSPPDLHNLKDETGKFPFIRIQQVITGEVEIPVHGSREMPVWGRYFRAGKGDSVARLNIYALTKYIQAIQTK